MDLGFTGEQVIEEARRLSPRILISFSTGKDSIGMSLALRDAGFEDIQPFYLYQIPGNLAFIEESLDYYERNLFNGIRIVRMPHPSIQRGLRKAIFQPPDRLGLITEIDIQPYSSQDVADDIIGWLGWPSDALTAIGIRAADSQNRYSLFKRKGMAAAINVSAKKFYPIADWNKERLLDKIKAAGLKLPVDYRLFGKTFDGTDLRFIAPLREHFPADYQRVLDIEPFCDMEFFRYEHRQVAAQ